MKRDEIIRSLFPGDIVKIDRNTFMICELVWNSSGVPGNIGISAISKGGIYKYFEYRKEDDKIGYGYYKPIVEERSKEITKAIVSPLRTLLNELSECCNCKTKNCFDCIFFRRRNGDLRFAGKPGTKYIYPIIGGSIITPDLTPPPEKDQDWQRIVITSFVTRSTKDRFCSIFRESKDNEEYLRDTLPRILKSILVQTGVSESWWVSKYTGRFLAKLILCRQDGLIRRRS
jgi:hypothetical protein